MARLIVNPTSSSRREIPLGRALMSIGRDPSNDVVLPDAMVSRRHAVIEFRGSQYFLRDCNSSNGSLVNGDRISERSLRDGDLVAIGTARLLFREEALGEEGSAKVLQHPSAPRLQCPSCRTDHRKGDLFCRHCGASLVPAPPARAVCAACGTAIPLPARFCTACGTALPADVAGDPPPAAPPAPESVVAAEPAALPAAASSGALPPAGGSGVPAQPAEAPPPAPSEPPAPRAPGVDPSSMATVEPARASVAAAANAPASVRPFLSPSPRAGAPRPVRTVPTDRVPVPAAAPRLTEPAPARAREAAAERAGFGSRAAAALLDLAIVSAVQAALLAPAIWHWRARAPGADPAFLGVLLAVAGAAAAGIFGIGYYVYYWGVRGATPGKRVFGLCVQIEDAARPPGSTRAAVRLFGYVVSGMLLGVGFLMAAQGGRALHDRIAGTRVVRRERG